MKNKHLAIISSDIKAGGISKMIGIHALALVREGYKLSIILPNNSDAISSVNNYIQDNIEYNKLINIYKLNIFDMFLIKLGLSKRVNLILRSVDACFVHNAKLIPLIKNISVKPVFAVNHTAKYKQTKFYKKADLIFSVNKTIILELINFGINKNKCIYCPNVLVNLPNVKPKLINKNKIVIGALGRMVEKKGFYDYIDALKIIKKKVFSFEAILAGDGILYKDLVKYAEEIPELEFSGWINNKQEFFSKIDIFCQPSHFEPFGLTIIEAMSYGKAVISTKCDGPVEILNTNKKNGILVSRKKPSEMTDAIISLIKDSNLHKDMCDRAIEHIHKFYSLNNLQNNLVSSMTNYFQLLHEK